MAGREIERLLSRAEFWHWHVPGWSGPEKEKAMASIRDMIAELASELDNDPLVGAAVSAVLSPEGKNLVAGIVTAVADLEAKHAADKAQAVQDAQAAAQQAP